HLSIAATSSGGNSPPLVSSRTGQPGASRRPTVTGLLAALRFQAVHQIVRPRYSRRLDARDPVEGFDSGTIRGRRRGDRELEVGSATRGDIAEQPPTRLRGHGAVRIQTLDSQPHVGDPPGKTTVEVSLHGKAPAGISPLLELETKRAVRLSRLRH